MNKKLFSVAVASLMTLGVGYASAQTTTTTSTWTNDQGAVIRQDSTTNSITPFNDPSVQVGVGVVLPGTVMLQPLPNTINVPDRDRYSYTIVNNRPVVVERTTRKVIHTWD